MKAKLKKKKRFFNLLFSHSAVVFIVLIYIGIAHVGLPYFKRSDFLFFYNWDLFSSQPKKIVYDITCDQSKSFLFRDLRKQAKLHNINIHVLFALVNRKNIKRISKDYKSSLKLFCHQRKPVLVKMKGSLAEHIIFKKPLEIMERIEL